MKDFDLINIDFEKLDLSKFSNQSLVDLLTLGIYICIKNFIKWSKLYGLRKNEFELISDGCANLLDLITIIATQDVYINRSECLELILYVNKLSNYLKECCE